MTESSITSPNHSIITDAMGKKAALFQAVPPADWMAVASDDLRLELNAAQYKVSIWTADRLLKSTDGRRLTANVMSAYSGLLLLTFCEALCVAICRDVDDLAFASKQSVASALVHMLPALESKIDAAFFAPPDSQLYDEMAPTLSMLRVEREIIPPFVHECDDRTLILHGWSLESRRELEAYAERLGHLKAKDLANFWASPPDLALLVDEAGAILAMETEAPAHARMDATTVYASEMTPQSIPATLLLGRAALWSGATKQGEALRSTIRDHATHASMIRRQPQARAAIDLACSLGELLQNNWG